MGDFSNSLPQKIVKNYLCLDFELIKNAEIVEKKVFQVKSLEKKSEKNMLNI